MASGRDQIHIDAATVAEFAQAIHSTFDADVAPVANSVQLTFANGAIVGARNPSVDLSTMLNAYQSCLEAMSQQLYAYATAARILSDSAHSIAARYTTSDALAGASTTIITASLVNAISTTDAAYAPPIGNVVP
jgi:hypothetical protein